MPAKIQAQPPPGGMAKGLRWALLSARAGAIALGLNGEQNHRLARGGDNLAGIDLHGFGANVSKLVVNPKVFDLGVAGQQILEQRSQLGAIPLAVAQLKQQAPLSVLG